MRSARELIALPILVAVVAVVWFAVRASGERDHAAVRVEREDAALALVRRIAAAEAAFHEREGRYGWLEDLRAAGLLDGVAWRTDREDLAAATPGYRIEVLLPAAAATTELTPLATRAQGKLSERLARRHFVVVARPWDDAEGPWRTWVLDERDRVFVNEGVSDPLTRERPPLPSARVPDAGGTDPAGMRWWPLDDLPPR